MKKRSWTNSSLQWTWELFSAQKAPTENITEGVATLSSCFHPCSFNHSCALSNKSPASTSLSMFPVTHACHNGEREKKKQVSTVGSFLGALKQQLFFCLAPGALVPQNTNPDVPNTWPCRCWSSPPKRPHNSIRPLLAQLHPWAVILSELWKLYNSELQTVRVIFLDLTEMFAEHTGRPNQVIHPLNKFLRITETQNISRNNCNMFHTD